MMTRRTLLGSGLLALGGCKAKVKVTSAQNFTVETLIRQLREGGLTSTWVLDHYLERIAALNATGPGLRAVLEVNPQVRSPHGRGPLAGVPILIKDNIETADAMATTAGSLALLEGKKPAADAFIINRLREAGAVILGKSNLSEWANIRSPNSTSGWSARGGLTLNPHNLAHTASGSSSGSAAAVAAGLCAAAIGTETNGSIVSPAAACGIVGFKPTVGLVSRTGIIPITHWQDTAGPMTRTVWDAAFLLNTLAGVDDQDIMTRSASGQIRHDYASGLELASLKGKRLGVLRSMSGHHRGVRKLFDGILETLRQAGAILVDDIIIPHHRDAGSAGWQAMLTEFRQEVNQYLTSRGSEVQSLAEVIAFNEAHREEELPHFEQEFFIEAESRGVPEKIAEAVKLRNLSRRLSGPEGIDAALKRDRLDALICPTNDPAGRIDLAVGDANTRVFSTPAASAGYPHLTVPMGLVDDLPVGLSFVGPAWSDHRMLELGHAFESLRSFKPEILFI